MAYRLTHITNWPSPFLSSYPGPSKLLGRIDWIFAWYALIGVIGHFIIAQSLPFFTINDLYVHMFICFVISNNISMSLSKFVINALSSDDTSTTSSILGTSIDCRINVSQLTTLLKELLKILPKASLRISLKIFLSCHVSPTLRQSVGMISPFYKRENLIN